MKDRRTIAAILAAALTLTMCGVSAVAAEEADSSAAPDSSVAVQADQSDASATVGGTPEDSSAADTSAADSSQADASGEDQTAQDADTEEHPEPEIITPDAVGTVSFANVSRRLRENNLSVLSLEENINAIKAIDYDKMTDDIRKRLNNIADAQWFMTISGNSFAAKSMSSSYDSLKDSFDDIRDGKLQEDNEAVIRQLENAQDQVAMAGESLYIALTEMELNGQTLSRSITALDRTIKELNLRYDLGQISALTLEQTKAGRTSALSGQETLTMNIGTYKTQLEQMIGAELTGKIKLQGLPQVTGQQLAAMDLDKDLAAAKEASYTLFAAQRTLDDARDDFKDTAEANMYSTGKYQYVAAQHQWQAAQYTYNAAVQSFETSFRTLYLQVKDYQQVLQASKTALATEKDNFAAAQKKHDLGNLSDNALADAKDKVSEAQDKVDGAAIDLFSAYNNYRWAVDHGILN
ncbi:TolC family protein [Lawsonibacter sp. LCP25S3_F5]